MSSEIDVDPDLCTGAQHALEQARKCGASEAQVAIQRGEGLDVSVRLGEPETVEHARDQNFGVTVYFGQCSGHASSTDLREDSISQTVEAACQIARHTEQDPCHGLPEASLLAFDYPDLDLYHPWDLDAEAGMQLARECEDAARSDTRIKNSEGAEVSRYAGMQLLANSAGFMGGYRSSRASLSCCVVAADDTGAQVRDYWYSAHRDARQLDSPKEVGQMAMSRATRHLGARTLSTRSAPVLFEAQLARSLVGHFLAAASGEALYQEASFLLGQMDQKVWAEDISLVEYPRIPIGPASAPFDADGIATSQRQIVEQGVLRGWFLSHYAARRLKLEPTGNAGGVRNLKLESGAETLQWEALLKQLDRGLVVTELLGQGVNPVTGDYSRGAAGFWVEDGEIAYPVHEITIAGTLQEMFRGVVAVGAQQDCRGAVHTGALLIEKMQIAGA